MKRCVIGRVKGCMKRGRVRSGAGFGLNANLEALLDAGARLVEDGVVDVHHRDLVARRGGDLARWRHMTWIRAGGLGRDRVGGHKRQGPRSFIVHVLLRFLS